MSPMIFVLVFVGVFALIALPLVVAGSARTSKQVLASLDSALSTDARFDARADSLQSPQRFVHEQHSMAE